MQMTEEHVSDTRAMMPQCGQQDLRRGQRDGVHPVKTDAERRMVHEQVNRLVRVLKLVHQPSEPKFAEPPGG